MAPIVIDGLNDQLLFGKDSKAPSSDCAHAVNVCKQCMANYVETEINRKGDINAIR
jgi:hypothetical protein